MSDKLVIVESPAKAKTIGKYLGAGYRVLASVGHVRDLPEGNESIDVEHDFAPTYVIMPDKEQVVSQLRTSARAASAVYMATDPDREGEAIAWHIVQAINIPKKTPIHRVTFTEITPNAVKQAIERPRDIDMSLVDAQQARRILDRLVGYRLSRVLWKRVRRGLSAGRVQSVAVRLVVEREREIQAFVPQEYWSIEADLLQQKAKSTPFRASLIEIAGRKLDKFDIANASHANQIVADLTDAQWQVANVKRSDKRRNAAPPFTTSTMQQEASRKLGFSAKKTMIVAQQLYEGIDLGSEGTVGLITYMRTDSVNVSQDAQQEARAFIQTQYGADAVPAKPNTYTTKARGAQEAHEAIRPTAVHRMPATLKTHLSHDQSRLYDLIWKRFVASQMAPAIFDSMTVDIAAGKTLATPAPYTFRATGSVLKVPGFLAVYNVSLDDGEEDEDSERRLPLLAVAEPLMLKTLTPNQHFTEPPPRYSDASLIKELERLGIGRPSTYSPTIATIVDRKYVELQNQRFVPTVLGSTVNDLLVQDFANIVDYEFTSDLEKRLDTIAEGNMPWVPVVRSFYEPFNAAIVANTGDRVDVGTGLPCPKCDGGMLIVRFGRQGEFVGCNRYPECQFTSDFSRDEHGRIALKGRSDDGELTVVPDVTCDICAGPMVMRKGRFGNFLACTKYPECRGTRKIGRDGKPVAPPEPTGVSCPKCTQGQLLARRGKFGRPFYGCNRYPQCDYLVNDLAEVANFDPTTASSTAKPTRTASSATKPTRKASSTAKPARKASSTAKPARKASSTAKPARKASSTTKPARKASSTTKPARKASSATDVVESVKKIVM
jgi:DNA topoisomerase-1